MYDARNYKGFHVTAQLSKAAERVLGTLFVPQLLRMGAFGHNQIAYMPEHGARGVLIQLMLHGFICSWTIEIASYCSGVSGAFDKFSSSRFLPKLRACGIPDAIFLMNQKRELQ